LERSIRSGCRRVCRLSGQHLRRAWQVKGRKPGRGQCHTGVRQSPGSPRALLTSSLSRGRRPDDP
jgi:hypothetical protein